MASQSLSNILEYRKSQSLYDMINLWDVAACALRDGRMGSKPSRRTTVVVWFFCILFIVTLVVCYRAVVDQYLTTESFAIVRESSLSKLFGSRWDSEQPHLPLTLEERLSNVEKAVVFSADSNPLYSFYLPLTTFLWKHHIGYDPVVIVTESLGQYVADKVEVRVS